MKQLLTGNEAIARGAYEAGVAYASAYPGTPSTEILENIAAYKEIVAQWDPNEKVAMETAIGASIAGARSLAAMKMVGVNVAADPLFSFAYSGVNGGMLLISADDPGMHSSQNEQDNRHYAKFAKVAMVEPSDSQEAKEMVRAAMEISEQFDTPVLMRVTTRVCHSKSLVEIGEPQAQVKKPYVKNLQKFDLVPAISRKLRVNLEERLAKLKRFAEETPLNFIEWHDKKIGVISSGIAYQYVREVFGEQASYLKLGFTYPLPLEKIKSFAAQVETVYVVEELEPYLEEQIKAAGVACVGKEKIPPMGELNPDIVAKALLGQEPVLLEYDQSSVVNRPPTLCAGCPHRSFFYELGKRKDIMISGDIGCYGLGGAEPLNAKDSCICMGGGPSLAHGAQKMFNHFNENMRTVSVVGDSTFFHTGINSMMTAVYNRSNTVACILDNRITGMTGHQENPGTGFTLQGEPTKIIDIPTVVKALGVDHIRVVNPMNLQELKDAFDWALALTEPAVIITRWPCVLKRLTEDDKQEFGDYKGVCVVDEAVCVGCKLCIKTGCPALQFKKEEKKTKIDGAQCVGCEVCVQVCPKKAIAKVGE
ncbi:MAG TPA: indolepyruvate ferredoxin oxidoreductase subunit alpha [Patescibacteria group bacterium]|nr:indolepyruvate ferredoxin oxidoreductase subunit alpha [Patescibacteria group bacterium]